MICEHCQTTLPDQAIACWKCGKPVAALAAPTTPTAPAVQAPTSKSEPDVLIVILAFALSAILFVCMGWAIPFTVWGKISGIATDYPQWSNLIGIISGISFVIATIGFLGGVWWGSYWLITRIMRPSVP